jgi:hypothetical protein
MPCKTLFSSFCSQASTQTHPYCSRGDPANLQGYVVRQGFMTGVTFNREVALAAQRGARNLSEWLFKPGHHQPEEPEQLTTPLIEIQSLFGLDWYNLHCVATESTGMPWASSRRISDRWPTPQGRTHR